MVTDARIVRSQEALLSAALEKLHHSPDATLSEIAQHAGVGRTTLYRLFPSRDALIRALALHCLGRMDAVTAPITQQAQSALDAIRLLFQYVMPLTREFALLMRVDQLLADDPEVVAIHRKHHRELAELIDYAKRQKEISAALSTVWLVGLIEGLFHLGWSVQTEHGYSAEEAAEMAYTSFTQGAQR
jgi:AcrR family transcriptional regulator